MNHSVYWCQPFRGLTIDRHYIFPFASPALIKPLLHSEKYFVPKISFNTIAGSKVSRLSLTHPLLFEPPLLWQLLQHYLFPVSSSGRQQSNQLHLTWGQEVLSLCHCKTHHLVQGQPWELEALSRITLPLSLFLKLVANHVNSRSKRNSLLHHWWIWVTHHARSSHCCRQVSWKELPQCSKLLPTVHMPIGFHHQREIPQGKCCCRTIRTRSNKRTNWCLLSMTVDSECHHPH